MCDRCRNAVIVAMPLFLSAAAKGFVQAGEEDTKDHPEQFHRAACEELASALGVMADLAMMARGSSTDANAAENIKARLKDIPTPDLRKMATLAFYAGDLTQNIAGMVNSVLHRRATTAPGDHDAADYVLNEVGADIIAHFDRDPNYRETPEQASPRILAVAMPGGAMSGGAMPGVPGMNGKKSDAPEYKH